VDGPNAASFMGGGQGLTSYRPPERMEGVYSADRSDKGMDRGEHRGILGMNRNRTRICKPRCRLPGGVNG
jgi:hypothetical protein